MSNQHPTAENKCDTRINFDSDEASGENNEDSDIMKEIELSMKKDQAENEKLPKEIVINGRRYTDIRVRDANINSLNQEDDNLKQIEECMRRDQKENKNLPDKAVINGHEFTNIKVRDIQVEPKNQEDDNIKQIEECMRRDQEENKNLPDKAVINGHEFTNIKVRDIQVEPRNQEDDNLKQIEECMRRDQEENKKLPDKAVIDGHEFTNIRVRDIQVEPRNQEDDNIKQIEECMHRDQEENKKLPNKAVIDGHEFTNIRVREITLDHDSPNPTFNDSKPNRPPPRKWNYVYDRSVFYQKSNTDTTPTKVVRAISKPIKLTVTLKDIGMEDFYEFSIEEELPKLNNNKQNSKTKKLANDSSNVRELPKLDNHKNKSIQAQIQEPTHESDKNKSPRKKKEQVSTYDRSIFYTKDRQEFLNKPVRYFNDPIKLTVTLKDIGMDGFESPLPKKDD